MTLPGTGKQQVKQVRHDNDMLAQLLFGHGDVRNPLQSTIRTLDSIVTDYIIQVCFGAGQSAALHGRAKVKVDDVLYALRDNPVALGRIEEKQKMDKGIKKTRKAMDPNEEAMMEQVVIGDEELGKKGKGKKRKAEGVNEFGAAFKKNLKGGKSKAFA